MWAWGQACCGGGGTWLGGKPAREPRGPWEAFVFHLVGPECSGKGLVGEGHGWAV